MSRVSECPDLVTCGLCGRRFPLKQLSSFIKHKALATCRRRQHKDVRRNSSSPPEDFLIPRVSKSGGDEEQDGGGQLNTAVGYKSLRSPSVSASNQTESSATLADSSGTEMEEEEEEEAEEEEEGVRRKSASSTSGLLDAATNTPGQTGE